MMEKKSISALSLMITYLFVSAAVYLTYGVLELFNWAEHYELLSVLLFTLSYIVGIIMTAVLLVDMARCGRYRWDILLLTFCSGGLGAALYPMLSAGPASEECPKERYYLAVYALLLAVFVAWRLFARSHCFMDFAQRNLWARYYELFLGVIGVYFAANQLQYMHCKHFATWFFALLLMLANPGVGSVYMLLMLMLYGERHLHRIAVRRCGLRHLYHSRQKRKLATLRPQAFSFGIVSINK